MADMNLLLHCCKATSDRSYCVARNYFSLYFIQYSLHRRK